MTMKNRITAAFFIFLCKISFSQVTYFNYLDYTSEWRNHSGGLSLYFIEGTGNEFETIYYVAHSFSTTYFNGDTLIQGNNYYKRITLSKSYYQNSPVVEINYSFSPFSFIREDVNGNFYEFDTLTSTEILVLDNNSIINLQEGENFSFDDHNCSIENIDTILFNNRPLTFLKGAVPDQGGAVEGIGIIDYPCFTSYESFSYLACYSKQDNDVSFSSDDCSFFPTPQYFATNIKKQTSNLFSIYPNPTNSNFTIRFIEEMNDSEVVITNQVGEIVQTYSNLSGKEIKIQRGTLNPGIYFVNLKSKNNTSSVEKICIFD